MTDWPLTLPADFQLSGYSDALPNAIVQDGFNARPIMMRRRTTAAVFPVKARMIVTNEEWSIMNDFFTDDLSNGVMPFNISAARGDDVWVVRFRSPPQRSRLAEDVWDVSMELEVLR